MKRAQAATVGLLLVNLWLAAGCAPALGQTDTSIEKSLVLSEAALRQGHYAEAIRILKAARKRSPEDLRLQVELGRAYIYDRQDDRAIRLLRSVLQQQPSNRVAKLELARVLGYRGQYEASNRLYRELLASNPDDEAAAIGLVRNLIHLKETSEARREVERGLARHPNSLRLQEYKDRLQKGEVASRERHRERIPNSLWGGVDYFTDSAGNKSWRAQQRFDYQFTRRMSNRVLVEERWLWRNAGPKASVLSGIDELQVQLAPWLRFGGGGGSVRFADGTSRPLYRGGLELHPARRLWLDGNFSRIPINPTFRAAGFNLLAEGWQTRVSWHPGPWRFNADWSRQHYSDSNRRQREGAEVLRWIGTPRLAFASGYRIDYFTFDHHFAHGYFNPARYERHMGLAGLSIRLGSAFRGEYLARIGAESVSRAPYQFAWEAALRNRVLIGNWELGGDYFYFHLAQSTGAFRAHAGSLVIAYRF